MLTIFKAFPSLITIDITRILSSDLKSRVRAKDLRLFIENSGEKDVCLEFSKVKFATRSFIDEFYNLFLKNPEQNPFNLSITQVPEDIGLMLESVSHTQTRVKTIPASASITQFQSVEEALAFLRTATF